MKRARLGAARPRAAGRSGESKKIEIFGFAIEKSTSFTSLAAFILAIWGAGTATLGFLQGSNPSLLPLQRIMLVRDPCYTDKPLVNIIVPIAIYNKSAPKYSSIISDIRISFSADRSYTYDSESYVTLGNATKEKVGKVGCPKELSNLIYFYEHESQVPTEVVKGGGALVKNVFFAPLIPKCTNGGRSCYTRNYLYYSEFVNWLRSGARKEKSLDFSVTAIYGNGTEETRHCTIPLNADVIGAILKHKHLNIFCNSI